MFATPHTSSISAMSHAAVSSNHLEILTTRRLPRSRPRGNDGRFVPKATVEHFIEEQERKVCGWCHTSSTSQWRVGPTDGSPEMGTLCNACGINYRRALTKSPGGLNLDLLARSMGSTRLSIQKAIKRQRKAAMPVSPPKRARSSRNKSIQSLPNTHAPASPIAMLLCNNSSAITDIGSLCAHENYSNSFKGSSTRMSPVADETSAWQRNSGRTKLASPTFLPPFQSLLGCIEGTVNVGVVQDSRFGY